MYLKLISATHMILQNLSSGHACIVHIAVVHHTITITHLMQADVVNVIV